MEFFIMILNVKYVEKLTAFISRAIQTVNVKTSGKVWRSYVYNLVLGTLVYVVFLSLANNDYLSHGL
jgi:hypothetical protein